MIAPLAKQQQIKIDNRISESLPDFVTADQTRLKEVMLNLMSNALKNHPDLILLDMQLPQMDGYESAPFKNYNPAKKTSSIPVIALSADAMVEDINRAMKLGFSGYITKPLDVPNFLQMLNSYLKN